MIFFHREANYSTLNINFDNFPEFQSVISDSPSTRERHYHVLCTKIDM